MTSSNLRLATTWSSLVLVSLLLSCGDPVPVQSRDDAVPPRPTVAPEAPATMADVQIHNGSGRPWSVTADGKPLGTIEPAGWLETTLPTGTRTFVVYDGDEEVDRIEAELVPKQLTLINPRALVTFKTVKRTYRVVPGSDPDKVEVIEGKRVVQTRIDRNLTDPDLSWSVTVRGVDFAHRTKLYLAPPRHMTPALAAAILVQPEQVYRPDCRREARDALALASAEEARDDILIGYVVDEGSNLTPEQLSALAARGSAARLAKAFETPYRKGRLHVLKSLEKMARKPEEVPADLVEVAAGLVADVETEVRSVCFRILASTRRADPVTLKVLAARLDAELDRGARARMLAHLDRLVDRDMRRVDTAECLRRLRTAEQWLTTRAAMRRLGRLRSRACRAALAELEPHLAALRPERFAWIVAELSAVRMDAPKFHRALLDRALTHSHPLVFAAAIRTMKGSEDALARVRARRGAARALGMTEWHLARMSRKTTGVDEVAALLGSTHDRVAWGALYELMVRREKATIDVTADLERLYRSTDDPDLQNRVLRYAARREIGLRATLGDAVHARDEKLRELAFTQLVKLSYDADAEAEKIARAACAAEKDPDRRREMEKKLESMEKNRRLRQRRTRTR